MQPYFLPYIGYWQLMNVVDKYVIYDDVNYINRGWINRNRILLNDEPQYFNIPMLGASQNKLINEIEVNNEKKVIDKNLRKLQMAYKRAPYYGVVYPMIEKIMTSGKADLASYITESIMIISEYLDIKTELIISSSLDKNVNLKGQDKIIEICKLLQASEYYNAIGGRELYSFEMFRKNDIELKFLKTQEISYKQMNENFYPNLSILDVMMFNSKEEVKNMMNQYELSIE